MLELFALSMARETIFDAITFILASRLRSLVAWMAPVQLDTARAVQRHWAELVKLFQPRKRRIKIFI